MKFRILAIVTVLAVFLAGCNAHGGGWINSITGEGKATFGFTINCTQVDAHNIILKGKIQYNDHPADINLHADIYQPYTVTSAEISCDDPFIIANPTFIGTFRMLPSGEEGGLALVLTDRGEPGPSEGDTIGIRLYHGPAHSTLPFYVNGGEIGGGNIQFK